MSAWITKVTKQVKREKNLCIREIPSYCKGPSLTHRPSQLIIFHTSLVGVSVSRRRTRTSALVDSCPHSTHLREEVGLTQLLPWAPCSNWLVTKLDCKCWVNFTLLPIFCLQLCYFLSLWACLRLRLCCRAHLNEWKAIDERKLILFHMGVIWLMLMRKLF